MELDKNFIKKSIEQLGIKHGTRKVFEDFIICCSYAIANATIYNQEREDEYLNIIKKYSEDELEIIPKMFAALVEEFNKEKFEDILGNIYEDFDFSSKSKGQFFTPLHICKLMSQITFNKDTAKETIDKQGYISINDPCCGSGRLLLANLDTLKDNNIDLDKVYFEAGDISKLCCCMTYLNLSLLGMNAIVKQQDTLTGEVYDFYITPKLCKNKELIDKLVKDGVLVKIDKDKEVENEQ